MTDLCACLQWNKIISEVVFTKYVFNFTAILHYECMNNCRENTGTIKAPSETNSTNCYFLNGIA